MKNETVLPPLLFSTQWGRVQNELISTQNEPVPTESKVVDRGGIVRYNQNEGVIMVSRNARRFSGSGIYHIMFRGLNKQKLFIEKRDYEVLLETLSELKEKFGFELYAYCLMSNHAHFVIKERNLRDVSEIFHRLLTKYARWFNVKYDRSGVLMENRYKSKVVEDNDYFIHIVRYIHQNPIKAGLVEKAGDYYWSSYNDYLYDAPTLIDKEFLFEVLPKAEYEIFHKEAEERDFALYDRSKLTDEDMIEMLRRFGVENVGELKFLRPDKQEDIVAELRNKFSDRHIMRVTGITRYSLQQMRKRQ